MQSLRNNQNDEDDEDFGLECSLFAENQFSLDKRKLEDTFTTRKVNMRSGIKREVIRILSSFIED